jgi:hypothetical protein
MEARSILLIACLSIEVLLPLLPLLSRSRGSQAVREP